MNTKMTIGVLVLLLIGAAAWFFFAPAASQEVNGTPTDTAQGKRVFTWNLTDLGYGPEDMARPNTGITLTTGGKTYDLGRFAGSCSEIDGTSSWTLYDGEKTGVVCMWGGGGVEYGVFEEGGQVVVKQGDLDEGTAEIPGTRGNFKTILTLE